MRDWRVWAVLAIVLFAIVAIFLLQPIPQSEAYHNFADKRARLVSRTSSMSFQTCFFFSLARSEFIMFCVVQQSAEPAGQPPQV